MKPQISTTRSELVAGLPEEIATYLAPRLVRVSLPVGSRLMLSDKPFGSVFFPVTAVVGLANSDGTGRTAAVALAGCRDLIGVGAVLGSPVSIHDAIVLVEGDALQIARSAFSDAVQNHDPRRYLLRYAHTLMTQISFNSVCERLHTIEQRLIRWLLLGNDLSAAGDLPLTQDALATLMGSRRESVTVAAGKLQSEGLIQYRRGRIAMVNRVGLERQACQCYREIRAEYARMHSSTEL